MWEQHSPPEQVGKGYETQLEHCSSSFMGWSHSFTASAGFNSPGKHPERDLLCNPLSFGPTSKQQTHQSAALRLVEALNDYLNFKSA